MACVLAFFTAIPVSAAGADEGSPVIKFIEVRGNKRIEQGTIRAKLKSKEGISFSQSTVQKDIKSIYGLGYFDDVKVSIEVFEGGIKLIFIVTEKPIIISLDFQGNEEFDAEDLQEKVTITPGAISNHALIMDNADKIIAFYQSEGYWHVKVIPVIRKVSDDSVALTYQIEEGTEVTIDEIIIEGNEFVSADDITDAMETKEWWIFSFITGSGIFRELELKADVERIRDLYHSRGFIYVVISEPVVTLSDDEEELQIRISVSEEDQYRIMEVSFSGNTVFKSTKLYKNIELSSGEIFNRSLLRSDIDGIIDLYMEKGYAMADINPMIDVSTENKYVNITLSITEGAIYRIGRIKIEGNRKTRDKVIRREIRLDEGDIFNNKLLKRSRQRLDNLNYFESVALVPEPRPEEKLIDIKTTVKEKMTGMLTLGGGYSSVDKFMLMGEVTQSNLFGKGLYLKLRATLSARRTNYRISITDPWFMDKPISASFGLHKDVYQYPDYDKESIGTTIGFGKELSEYVGANITYKFEEVTISNIASNAADIISDQEGSKITSSISPAIWKDTRDNYLDPTTGSRNALYTTYAGVGGDNYFVKALADSIWYFPVVWDTTFSQRGRIGYGTGVLNHDLPLYERYYVGGISTVRGLGFGEGGPRDKNGELIGGNKELIFNSEYIFPIAKDIKLKGLLFFDYGTAFNDDEKISISELRATTGFGFRWISPFGPIRLEWGFNLQQKRDESANKIEFAIGGIF